MDEESVLLRDRHPILKEIDSFNFPYLIRAEVGH